MHHTCKYDTLMGNLMNVISENLTNTDAKIVDEKLAVGTRGGS